MSPAGGRVGDAGRAGDRRAAGSDGSDPRRTGTARTPYRRRRIAAGVLVALLVLAALAWGAWWALGRFGPGVEEIRVSGTRVIAQNDVRAAAGVPTGTSLAAVDTGAVSARISGIPGVAEAEVSRSWPHTLSVVVLERMPVAIADAPGGPRLVDATGLAYRPVPDPAPRLPKLALPRVVPGDPSTSAALAVVEALPQPVRDQVDSVELGPGGTTLELALTEGRRVLWGRWADPDPATTARRAAILGPLLSREGTVYDVSSADLPTVRK